MLGSTEDVEVSTRRPRTSSSAIAPRLLRLNDAARYLSMGTKALRALIVSGALPYVQMRPGNSPYLVDVKDLDKFVEMHKNRSADF